MDKSNSAPRPGPAPADPADPAPPRLSPEIFVYATNKNFLNLDDALRIGKIRWEVAGYDKASGHQTGRASAWLDVDDLRLLAHLITTRTFKDVLPKGRFESFGGSERDGAVESRTLVVEWDPGEGGRFAGYPYRVTITNGPGMRSATGAVQPKGEPTQKQSMRLPEADAMKILLAVLAYLAAWEATYHVENVAANLDAQAAARAARTAPEAAPTPAAAAAPRRTTPTPIRPEAAAEAAPAVPLAAADVVDSIVRAFTLLRKTPDQVAAILAGYGVPAVKQLPAPQAGTLLIALRQEYTAAQARQKGGAA
jgi:hypothetical protein